ncbi:thiol peroxidase [Lacticigenium naphthae]|uniref:thiol peroxidase n=1 Tax=Lacticigenium naphthae TaxID=515351 RepID=UPI00041B8548|nr:thiol peroxidase [Lacticigenium naphthae]
MNITWKGHEMETVGNLPKVGEKAPSFQLNNKEGKTVSLEDYKGEVVLLNVFPDINTSTCSRQTATFNAKAAELTDVRLISISANSAEEFDNWCAGKSVDMEMLIDAERKFGKEYGLYLEKKDKLARAVFVISREGQLLYREIVKEIADDPDYEEAIAEARHATADLT